MLTHIFMGGFPYYHYKTWFMGQASSQGRILNSTKDISTLRVNNRQLSWFASRDSEIICSNNSMVLKALHMYFMRYIIHSCFNMHQPISPITAHRQRFVCSEKIINVAPFDHIHQLTFNVLNYICLARILCITYHMKWHINAIKSNVKHYLSIYRI